MTERTAERAEKKDRWFDAGFALMAEGGYGNLKQAAVCERLGVTTGAFYHFFRNWQDYTDQLLSHWRDERTTRLVEMAQSERTGGERLEVLLGFVLQLPHAAEAAIRVWASIDPDVAVVQQQVDHDRREVVRNAFLQMVDDPAEADELTELGMLILIGYEQSGSVRPRVLERALRLVKELAEVSALASPQT